MALANAHSSRARGFSLLEVLVAFVILSLVATALFRLFSGALGNASAAGDYSRAMMVAESILAETAAGELREATQTGTSEDGQIAWTTRITPYAPPDVPPNIEQASETMPTRLYRVSAEVAFPGPTGARRTFELATLRIGAKDAK